MSKRVIFITQVDHARLYDIVATGGTVDKQYLNDLRDELDRAIVVDPADIPADVITMNTRVVLKDLVTGERMTCTLVFPGGGDFERGYVSILAPIGTALLGYRVGDIVEWDVPGGKTRIRIDEILFQPEASAKLRKAGHTPAQRSPA